jgi:hypothetical protein
VLGGEAAWGRLESRAEGTATPSRAAPIAWRSGAICPGCSSRAIGRRGELLAKARDVLAHLREAGASFLEDIVAARTACARRWRRRCGSWWPPGG